MNNADQLKCLFRMLRHHRVFRDALKIQILKTLFKKNRENIEENSFHSQPLFQSWHWGLVSHSCLFSTVYEEVNGG